MATFKVIAGDFGQGQTGQVLVGGLYRASAQGFEMPIVGHSFQTEHIGTGQIDTLEVATEENLKKLSGSVGWGVLGGVALGPIGALAGVLAGGRKTEVTFLCRFKDGRQFLGCCDVKTFTAIQAARFQVATRRAQPTTKQSPVPGLIVMAGLLIFIGVEIFRNSGSKVPTPSPSRTDSLNQPALKLVTYLLADDINGMLIRDQNSAVWPKVEDLLGWLRLNWRIQATEYEAQYDANEIKADDDFKGKKILITGTVSSVSKDFADEGYIHLRGSGFMGVRADLSGTGTSGAASFKKGQRVGLVCKGSGQLLTVATLDGCESLNDYINGLSPSLQASVGDFLAGGKPLEGAVTSPIVGMYVMGLHMPKDSPCLNGKRDACGATIKVLMKDKVQSQAIRTEANTMLASLKTN